MKKGAGLIRILGCMLLGLFFTGCASGDALYELPRESAPSVRVVKFPESSQEETEGNSEGDFGGSFLMKEAGDFACRSLSPAEQIWYHDIEEILGGFGGGVELSVEGIKAGLTESSIDRVFQCVLNDHPELFFVEGYSYLKYSQGDELTKVEFSGTYNVDRETALRRRQEIEEAAGKILAGIDADAADYDKVKYVYDTLIISTDYDQHAPDNQNIYSVLINRLSVCQGYAKATQYLLNRMGVECALVFGEVRGGEGHAWNLVNVDGSYYYVDTTWGDASYQTEGQDDEESLAVPEINYDYLNVTTDELLRTHVIKDADFMPECTAREANYYVRQGAWFSSCDRNQLQALFDNAGTGGKSEVAIKCADVYCYNELFDMLIGRQEIFDFWAAAERSIVYAKNDRQLSMTFWVTNP